jgi:peptidyl-prolyl cis-trans isomerase B (cyclophilin B)
MSTSQPPPLPPDMGNPTPRVVLETDMGQIVLELDREKAPKTVDNVLFHVENGHYDGLTFHRVIPGFMIQGGGFTPELNQRESPRPTVPNEASNGLKNARGTVAMARTSDPHSATTQFFINLADNDMLDFTAETPGGWGYAVFGHVVEGLEVVDAIAAVETGTSGGMNDVPVQSVIIERAYVQGG